MDRQEDDDGKLGQELRTFGASARTAAERPDAFWASQRARIASRLHSGTRMSGWRKALIWAPVAIVLLLGLFWFRPADKDPIPDIAAGYDQTLLIEVEQALQRKSPEALAPAGLITCEIKAASKSELE